MKKLKENCVALSEVAELINPRRKEGTGLVFRVSKVSYPLNPEVLPEGKATSYLLETGDVILQNVGNPDVYLVSDANLPEIYVSTYDVIIKCRKISPAYLFLYLTSVEGQKALKSIQSGTMVKHIALNDLRKLAIPLPDKADEVYEKEFEEKYLKR